MYDVMYSRVYLLIFLCVFYILPTIDFGLLETKKITFSVTVWLVPGPTVSFADLTEI